MCVRLYFFPSGREVGGVKSSDGPIIHLSYHELLWEGKEGEG